MQNVELSAFKLAQRFVNIAEVPGLASNPHVLAMLRLDQKWPKGDDVPWCSAFVNYIAWLLRLPRSKSLRARSWLLIGQPISIENAEAGFDVVILKRGKGKQPGPDVIKAPGHVGFFAGLEDNNVLMLGGNQKDTVNVSGFPDHRILGVRRLT
jgi:uncharacterized protein (TIGR02594 family)